MERAAASMTQRTSVMSTHSGGRISGFTWVAGGAGGVPALADGTDASAGAGEAIVNYAGTEVR